MYINEFLDQSFLQIRSQHRLSLLQGLQRTALQLPPAPTRSGFQENSISIERVGCKPVPPQAHPSTDFRQMRRDRRRNGRAGERREKRGGAEQGQPSVCAGWRSAA
ncbi:hypothetical protein AAFF_G00095920 [Aldrovandia affinis]|uniref:Uncharacterized protein n=1 Tax=Aldrovandia affinis TaxID=143900 RepID=A0AAD7RVM4_9TELE|nr:hypothetical protein AAFF_G00095920 [Aldrovandia affinis]